MRFEDVGRMCMLGPDDKLVWEEWRDLSVPGYHVSSFGRVFGDQKGKFLGFILDNDYFRVWLPRNGKTTEGIHVMVLETFGPPRPGPEYEVDHIKNIPYWNMIWNLQWLTRSQNIKKSFSDGREIISGQRHHAFGKKMSDESRKKMAEKKRKYWDRWREERGRPPKQ